MHAEDDPIAFALSLSKGSVLLAVAVGVLVSPVCQASTSSLQAPACDFGYLQDAAQPAVDQLHCLQKLKSDHRLASVSRKDIDKVLSALFPRLHLNGDSADADITILLADELKRRRPADASRDDSVFGALMATGRVDEAERLPYAKKLLIPRQPLATAPAPDAVKFWTVQETPLTLVEEAVDLDVGRHVVVYTSPGCGFCQMAAKELAADPLLGTVFKAQSLWIHTPNGNYGPDFFREWPLKQYSFPTRVVFDRHGWPQRRIPATPVFFFMEDGRVVGETLGWYKDSLSKMARQMAELGFLSH